LPPGAGCGVGGGLTYAGASVSASFGFSLAAADFTFLPVRHFCDANPRPFFVAPALAVNVFNRTAVGNHYLAGPNHRIMNLGIKSSLVAAVRRSEVRAVAGRDSLPAAGAVANAGRSEREEAPAVTRRAPAGGERPVNRATQLADRRQEPGWAIGAGRGQGPRGLWNSVADRAGRGTRRTQAELVADAAVAQDLAAGPSRDPGLGGGVWPIPGRRASLVSPRFPAMSDIGDPPNPVAAGQAAALSRSEIAHWLGSRTGRIGSGRPGQAAVRNGWRPFHSPGFVPGGQERARASRSEPARSSPPRRVVSQPSHRQAGLRSVGTGKATRSSVTSSRSR
jgi:hypothetical protein